MITVIAHYVQSAAGCLLISSLSIANRMIPVLLVSAMAWPDSRSQTWKLSAIVIYAADLESFLSALNKKLTFPLKTDKKKKSSDSELNAR